MFIQRAGFALSFGLLAARTCVLVAQTPVPNTASEKLQESIQRALALSATPGHGSIKDVRHIVILTQENRSFDHYFGTLRGVRGFGDPRAVTLRTGKSVWHQPDGANEILPYRPDVPDMGMTFMQDVEHGWNDSHQAWNGGNYDQWVPSKNLATMTYMTRRDIPYHFALADAFTICDAYYCSLLGPTDPNRYHMWTGWVGNDGKNGGPVISNAEAGYDWSTFPERLQKAGISWKVYQDVGTGLDAAGYWGWTVDPYIGNYGDNSLLYFHQYQNALPGSPLADFAKAGTQVTTAGALLDQFRTDVNSGRLPQVSWIAAPEAFTEHPNWPANYGAWYISQFLDALTSNPEVWRHTVVFLNYDENGGFFDHLVPPTPPAASSQGASTVDTVNEIYPGDASTLSGPYGLGVRVPMIIISPWSKGGFVDSQVFDHTSLIRFIEARFAGEHPEIVESNITPWRRAVAGDLTSAFDFAHADAAVPSLPSTAAYLPADHLRHPDFLPAPPSSPAMPVQEPGVRLARPLPYELHTRGSVHATSNDFQVLFQNSGEATAVFQVWSAQTTDLPRSYTVEPGKSLSDTWAIRGSAGYDLSVHGPNGFLRTYKGSLPDWNHADVDVRAHIHRGGNLRLSLENQGLRRAEVRILDHYTGKAIVRHLEPREAHELHWESYLCSGWYDVTITVVGDATFERHLAGHIETGRVSISDPALSPKN